MLYSHLILSIKSYTSVYFNRSIFKLLSRLYLIDKKRYKNRIEWTLFQKQHRIIAKMMPIDRFTIHSSQKNRDTIK